MQSPDPEITDHFNRMIIYHARVDHNVPPGAVILIGDSLVQGLCVSAVATPSVNYGIGSDTTVGVLQRLPLYPSLARAGAIVLAIGVNDFRRRPNAEIIANYRQILDAIPGSSPIVINAVLPQDETNRPEWKDRNTERIQPLNRELAGIAAANARLSFVNVGSEMINAEGNLREDLNVGDGIHLNAAGNAIWIQGLQQAVTRVRPSP